MGKHCCIPNCNGNYSKKNREKIFRFPRTPEEKERWISAIPKYKNHAFNKNSVICERHWPSEYEKKNRLWKRKTK